jgi:hypothetical protein
VLPTRRLLIAAVAVCLAVCPATAPMLRAAPHQAPSGSNSAPVSGAPVITANPERVKLSDGNGTTEIIWDTGNGSMGFVFVTEEGGKSLRVTIRVEKTATAKSKLGNRNSKMQWA